jgi:hypothetical protein
MVIGEIGKVEVKLIKWNRISDNRFDLVHSSLN